MKKIETSHWQSFQFLANAISSPNKQALAYVVSTTDFDNDKYNHNVWIYQKDRNFQLTACDKVATYSWLNDSTLLFVGNRKDKDDPITSDVYKISIYGGEATHYLNVPGKCSNLTIINEDEFLFISQDDDRYPDFYKANKEEKEKIIKERKDNEYYQEITQIPFYSNGGTYTSYKRNRLYRFDKVKEKLTPLTKMTLNVMDVQLNNDKTKALVLAQTHREVGELTNDLYELDLKTNKLKKLTKTKQSIYKAVYVKDAILCVVKEHNGVYGLNQNPVVASYNAKTKQLETIVDPLYSIGNSINSDARLLGSSLIQVIDDTVYFPLNVHDHSRLVKLVDNKLETVLDVNGSLDGFASLYDEIIMIAMIKQNRQELITLKQQVLTNHNKENEDLQSVEPIELLYEVDKRKRKGWVMLPPQYNPKKKYPAILNIHGGPKTIYGTVYVHEMQVWANQGYIVMYTNPSGSDGQDNAFSDIRGKYGTIDYDELMGFVDEVLKQYPSIDQKRLGVTGGSYGGFMTNWIIGHTNRFACAITQRSISNWTSFYGVSDIGYFFTDDQQQANLLKPKDIDKLWWHSPIKYCDVMKTPTLIIHSEKDYRCPIEQAYQLFSVLKENKVETKMIMFHHENHDLSRSGKPKARQKRLDEMLDWFNQYLQ